MRPVPDRASRAKCRSIFEEIYATELKERSPTARLGLAHTLLAEAVKTPEGSADRFVLLKGAVEAAAEGQDLSTSFDAATQLAGDYNIDAVAVKANAAATAFANQPSSQLATPQNLQSLCDLADAIIAEDEHAVAPRVASHLQRAASSASDVLWKAEAKSKAQELAAYQDARQKAAPAMEKLKGSPNDPAANFTVGSFICMQRGRWDKGLPLLAKSSGQTQALATAELSSASDTEQKLKLADGWYALAQKLPAPDRAKTLDHAASLYRNAEPDATGLQKLLIKKRLEAIPQRSIRGHVDLLALFNPDTDVVRGVWRIQGASLVVEPGELSGRHVPL